jgi:hypothetical protein
VSSVGLSASLDSLGSWAWFAALASALVGAVAALFAGVPLGRAPAYGLVSGVGTFILFPFAFVAIAIVVLSVYAALGAFCVLIDLLGLPSDWCL